MCIEGFEPQVAELEVLCRAGDKIGFVQLLHDRLGVAMLAYLVDVLGRGGAEEALQELWHDVSLHPERFQPTRIPGFDGTLLGLQRYLLVSARRVAGGFRRLDKARKRGGSLTRRPFAVLAGLDDGHRSVVELVANAEEMRLVSALLDELERVRVRQGQAVRLRFVEGLTYARIGEVLGIQEDGAIARVRRGLKWMRDQLGREAEGPATE